MWHRVEILVDFVFDQNLIESFDSKKHLIDVYHALEFINFEFLSSKINFVLKRKRCPNKSIFYSSGQNETNQSREVVYQY